MDKEGSDGSFRVRVAAGFSLLLRVREAGRYESLDSDCMSTDETGPGGRKEGGERGDCGLRVQGERLGVIG